MITINKNYIKIKPIMNIILAIFLLLMGLMYLIAALLYDGITSIPILDYLFGGFFIVIGFIIGKLTYYYNEEYFIIKSLKEGDPIKLKEITEITPSNRFGVYIIKTNGKQYHISLFFQKKIIKQFADHVKSINKNCYVDLD